MIKAGSRRELPSIIGAPAYGGSLAAGATTGLIQSSFDGRTLKRITCLTEMFGGIAEKP